MNEYTRLYHWFVSQVFDFGAKYLNFGGRRGWVGPPGPRGTFHPRCVQKKLRQVRIFGFYNKNKKKKKS